VPGRRGARRLRLAVLPLALAGTLAGCSERPALRVEHAWLRSADSGATTAGYLTLVNGGADSLRVTGASGSCAEAIGMHETVRDGGRVAMREAQEFRVPPGARLEFAPGGNHLMLTHLRRRLVPGRREELSLRLSDGRTVPVEATVRP
jgi:hypothetical protein